jgi:hypothetical protein
MTIIALVAVFFSTCNAVTFYGDLLNYIDIPVLSLHGKQKQKKRTTTFFEFCNADTGIMVPTLALSLSITLPPRTPHLMSMLLHCCHTAITLLLHSYHTALTLPLHCTTMPIRFTVSNL